jgi:glycosyltransferase involved in cell wall biosynthesis
MRTSKNQLEAPNTPALRVCMLAYTFYETDGRVIRYAQALVQDRAIVTAIVLRKPGQSAEESIDGVRVLRVQEREKNERGPSAYLARMLRFFFRSMIEVTRCHAVQPFDVIHVHSVPDFEVFAAWIPKLMGARVILDIHDIVPEFYAAKFKVGEDSAAFKALQWLERVSGTFADHVIAANDIWLAKLTSRSVRPDKCSVFINYPDLNLFDPRLRMRGEDGRFVVLYPGTLNWHQGVDIAIRAFALACREAPGMEFHIYGEGSSRSDLVQLIGELGLTGRVRLEPPKPIKDIAAVMANADLGVVPKRNDSFGGEAFSTKILEFMALGTPLVVSATRIDRHYFDDSLLRFFTPDNEADLARAMLDAYRDRARSARLAANAQEFVQRISWANKQADYKAIVSRLSRRRA